MRRLMLIVFAISSQFISLSPSYAAEYRYITDVLFVPIRSGEGSQFRILHKGVQSGSRLELISENEETGYSMIKRGEMTGYLPTRYLTTEESAREKLEKVSAELEKIKTKQSELLKNSNELSGSKSDLQQKVQALNIENDRLENELSAIKKISANAINLDRSNSEFIQKNETLKNELELMTNEVARLRENERNTFMIYGASFLFGGIFLGWLLVIFGGSRKKNDWG